MLYTTDENFMREALKEANKAYLQSLFPTGALIVLNNKIIARAHSGSFNDFMAHAELQVLDAAAKQLDKVELQKCTLYCTTEPCIMCAGAAFWAQIGKIVYGSSDNKRGFRKVKPIILHQKTIVVSGVLEKECSRIIHRYFIENQTKILN